MCFPFSGLCIRFCIVPVSANSAVLQCLAVPASKERLVEILQAQTNLGNPLDIASPGVPCLRLPFLDNPGITTALGILEDSESNWGMGLLPPLILHGNVAPEPKLPSRGDMEREMIGLLRSVALPNAKTTSDLSNMLAGRTMAWEDFEAPGLPAIWQAYTDLENRDNTDRERHSGEPNISFFYTYGQCDLCVS